MKEALASGDPWLFSWMAMPVGLAMTVFTVIKFLFADVFIFLIPLSF
jgi:hypothetical protein